MTTKRPDWFPDWEATDIGIIVASGPSVAQADLSIARGRARFVALNSSYRICPWADICYGSDVKWWQSERGLTGFQGLRVAGQIRAAEEFPGIRHLNVLTHSDMLNMDPLGTVGSGGNSGFHAINMLAQIGVKRIIAVGLDVRVDLGSHWHGNHAGGLNNPSQKLMKRWKKSIDGAAAELKRLGIEILNASSISTLEAYEKVTFAEAVQRWCRG